MAQVGLPLTGSGDATAQVATDEIGGAHYQRMKLHDAADGSTVPARILETTPGSTDGGLVVRPIGSTEHYQAIVGTVIAAVAGQVGLSSGSSAVELTSAGSTRLAGRFDINNQPTVDLSSVGSTRLVGRVTVDSPSTVYTVNGAVGITSGASAVGITSGSSAVELTSAGSTRLVGRVTLDSPSTVYTVNGAVGITSGASAVGITSGSSAVELTSAGSTRSVGTVNQGTPAGTSADAWWVRTVTTGSAGGSTAVDLSSGGSTRTVGVVGQGPGSSASPWFVRDLGYTSGLTSRSSVATSVDIQVVAGTSARQAMIVANRSTVQTVGIGFSTGVVTTALANVDVFIPPSQHISFGFQGTLPLYLGPLRAINLTSTAVAGSVAVTQFLSS